MTCWEQLAFAVMHAEAMKYTQVSIDPMQLAQAMQAAQQQARQVQSALSSPFDPRLIFPRG